MIGCGASVLKVMIVFIGIYIIINNPGIIVNSIELFDNDRS